MEKNAGFNAFKVQRANDPAGRSHRADVLADAASPALRMRFRNFLEASPDAVIVIDQSGLINFASNRIEAIFGYLPDELVGRPLGTLIPEQFRKTHDKHLEFFRNAPVPRMMGTGRKLPGLRKDGSEFLVEISLNPFPTSDGLFVIAAIRDNTVNNLKGDALEIENTGLRGLLAQAETDAMATKAAKRMQRLLLEESHHRLKNLLATVLAITSHSLRNTETLEKGRLAVESRLLALSRAHDVLLQATNGGMKLIDVIRAAVEPFESHQARRFIVQEIPVQIGPGAILPLTLSLNELCTNAVKYGALSNLTGLVTLALTVDETTQRFRLIWTETGGPAVMKPMRRSFGTRLIERLADQLHGTVRLHYDPAGLVYELETSLPVLRTLPAS